MISLFAHIRHDDNEVEPCIAPAQHHDDINGIENSSEEQDRQNDTSKMRDPLKML